MSEPIQSISQGNYILQGTVATSAGIVGDGSPQNPIRVDMTNTWVDVTDEFSATTALSPSYLKATYNPYLGMVQLGGSFYCSPTTSAVICTAPKKYKPINTMEIKEGSRYYDFIRDDTNDFLRARTGAAQWVSINCIYACNNTATN